MMREQQTRVSRSKKSPSQTLRVAAIQMCSTPNKAKNLSIAETFLTKAVQEGAEMVCFPENFTLFTERTKDTIAGAELPTGPTLTLIRGWAKKHRVWVLAGSMPILVSGSRKLSNSSFMINPQGKIVKRYDKIHLFDVSLKNDRSYHESKTFLAGTRISLAKTPWASVGMSICYDIRFAELYRKLSQQGSKLLMVPSSFTKPTGKAHWDCLTRVRAIENQCFLVAPAQTGSPYPGRLTYGHSRIVDPWGRVLCEKKTGTGFIIADLDFMELQKIRNEFPALKNRRLKV